MFEFIIGAVIGGVIGVLVMAIVSCAKDDRKDV